MLKYGFCGSVFLILMFSGVAFCNYYDGSRTDIIHSANITASASAYFDSRFVPQHTCDTSGLDTATGLLHHALYNYPEDNMWYGGTGAYAAHPAGLAKTLWKGWIQYVFDTTYKLGKMWVWNYNDLAGDGLKRGLRNVRIHYSVDGINWTELGTGHTFAKAPGQGWTGTEYAHNTEIDFGGVAAKYVLITAKNTQSGGTWGDIAGNFGLSEIRFCIARPSASNPSPADGAIGIPRSQLLSWTAGEYAASHNVYLGTDAQAVAACDDPNTLPGRGNTINNFYRPALALEWGTQYYWRVDEIDNAGRIQAGNVWSFTTVDRIAKTVYPADGGVGIDANTDIFWQPSDAAPYTYDVYLGVNQDAVANAKRPAGDVDGNGMTNFYDVAMLCESWLMQPNGSIGADINGDGMVDFADFAMLSYDWNTSASAEFKGNQARSSFHPSNLQIVTTYYWRVDQINGSQRYKGDTLSFRTDDPVAWWKFNEGSGTVGHDFGGAGVLDAAIHGASWMHLNNGYALAFDGINDYVECNASSLDIEGPITLEAWVYVEPNQLSAEPGIVGKGISLTYPYAALTYYGTAGSFCFYTSGGNNYCSAGILLENWTGNWHHVAGTFDGSMMKIYDNGTLVSTRASAEPNIPSITGFLIGRNGGYYFKGLIDEVRVYRRAISDMEVENHFKYGWSERIAPYNTVVQGETLQGDGFNVIVGSNGGMELIDGNDHSLFTSSFSYPGTNIGWNQLAPNGSGEGIWQPQVHRDGSTVVVDAMGSKYALHRVIQIEQDRIKVEDTLTNTAGSVVGIMVDCRVATPEAFKQCLLSGTPASSISLMDFDNYEGGCNPTIFISGPETSLGVVAEDDIFRGQFEAAKQFNWASFRSQHFSLSPGQNYKFEWAIYPLGGNADYFTMINRVRNDWNTNFKVEGPAEFGYTFRYQYPSDPNVLRMQFERKPIALNISGSALEYPSNNTLTRAAFKSETQTTIAALSQASPGIKSLGWIEASLIVADYAAIPNGQQVIDYINSYTGTVYAPLPANLSQIIIDANLPWKDSYVLTEDGRVQIEIFDNGNGIKQTALMVYPAVGNYQEDYLLSQVQFLIDDVGMDGIYFDTFGFGNDYSKWDGVSVNIDKKTGCITKQYTDTYLASSKVRKDICEYIFSKGKVVMANGPARFKWTQSLPIYRSMEATDIIPFNFGQKPPLYRRICWGHLGSPIAMSAPSTNAQDAYKAVITYLRHGLVCYYYNTNFSAESGDYGPFHHMFPMTPIELHEGWILGQERLMTCVSGTYTLISSTRPSAHLFDNAGREKANNIAIESMDANTWRITVNLLDWSDIAVIER